MRKDCQHFHGELTVKKMVGCNCNPAGKREVLVRKMVCQLFGQTTPLQCMKCVRFKSKIDPNQKIITPIINNNG